MIEKEKLEDYSISSSVKPQTSALNKIGIIGCGSMGQDIALLITLCPQDRALLFTIRHVDGCLARTGGLGHHCPADTLS